MDTLPFLSGGAWTLFMTPDTDIHMNGVSGPELH